MSILATGESMPEVLAQSKVQAGEQLVAARKMLAIEEKVLAIEEKTTPPTVLFEVFSPKKKVFDRVLKITCGMREYKSLETSEALPTDFFEEVADEYMDDAAKAKRAERQRKAHEKKLSVATPNLFEAAADEGSDEEQYLTEEAAAKRKQRAEAAHSKKESVATPDIFGDLERESEEDVDVATKHRRDESNPIPDLGFEDADDYMDDAARAKRDARAKAEHCKKESIAMPNIFGEGNDGDATVYGTKRRGSQVLDDDPRYTAEAISKRDATTRDFEVLVAREMGRTDEFITELCDLKARHKAMEEQCDSLKAKLRTFEGIDSLAAESEDDNDECESEKSLLSPQRSPSVGSECDSESSLFSSAQSLADINRGLCDDLYLAKRQIVSLRQKLDVCDKQETMDETLSESIVTTHTSALRVATDGAEIHTRSRSSSLRSAKGRRSPLGTGLDQSVYPSTVPILKRQVAEEHDWIDCQRYDTESDSGESERLWKVDSVESDLMHERELRQREKEQASQRIEELRTEFSAKLVTLERQSTAAMKAALRGISDALDVGHSDSRVSGSLFATKAHTTSAAVGSDDLAQIDAMRHAILKLKRKNELMTEAMQLKEVLVEELSAALKWTQRDLSDERSASAYRSAIVVKRIPRRRIAAIHRSAEESKSKLRQTKEALRLV